MLRATLKPLPIDVTWLISFCPCDGPFKDGPRVQTIELRHGYDLELSLGSLGRYILHTTLNRNGKPVIHVKCPSFTWLDKILGVSYYILSGEKGVSIFCESNPEFVVNITARMKP